MPIQVHDIDVGRLAYDAPGVPLVERIMTGMPHDPAVVLVRPPALATQVPYAYAAIVGPGRTVFTAGACPLDPDGSTVAHGDVAGQARQVMANLTTTLRAAGAELTDVVRTTVYVATTHRSDLVTAWEVVRAAFGDHDAPSTLLGVTVLGYAEQLVEVEATAVLVREA